MSQYGGAILISGNVTAYIISCSFISNYALYYGGAIYAQQFARVEISGNTKFDSNRAYDLGDDIYAGATKNTLKLNSLGFTNP